MAITVFKTFAPNEVLTASDLNASFLQIVVNGEDVPFPRTKDAAMAGFSLTLDADGNTSVRASTDDQVDWAIGGTDRVRFDVTGIYFNGIRLSGIESAAALSEGHRSQLALQLMGLESSHSLYAAAMLPGGV